MDDPMPVTELIVYSISHTELAALVALASLPVLILGLWRRRVASGLGGHRAPTWILGLWAAGIVALATAVALKQLLPAQRIRDLSRADNLFAAGGGLLGVAGVLGCVILLVAIWRHMKRPD
jgi:hypothetical protein